MNAIRSILVPIDFTYVSNAALDEAMRLADATGARLQLLHVVSDLPTPMGPAIPSAGGELSLILAKNEEEARGRLEGMLTQEQKQRFGVQVATTVGSTPASIVRQAKHDAADLIVMGTHARGAWSRLFHGSVSDKVVKQSPCPVVLCPPRVETAADTEHAPARPAVFVDAAPALPAAR